MCVNPNDPIFYVYVYLDPRKPGKYVYGEYEFDYEPFYVGKGNGKRAYAHLRGGTNKKFIDNIKEIGLPIIIFYAKGLTDYDAYILEGKINKSVGRLINKTGPLYNILNQHGVRSGYHHKHHKKPNFTNEQRKMYSIKMSNQFKGKPKSENHRKKLSDAKKNSNSPNHTKQWKIENTITHEITYCKNLVLYCKENNISYGCAK
jgi:hypothetical protein